ncbi:MAG: glycosyltransferase family 4 protein [Patescibacteria group bacterium]|nr:glycosyltransferase family 4 protein [Patescibacteria group bacterium]
MKIGIDCRMYGLKYAGIGRYVMNLVKELMGQDQVNEYVLFFNEENQNAKIKIQNENPKCKIIFVNINHYSLKEQLLFPFILSKKNLDLMHFPAFNLPVFYFGKYVVTIHDLIKHTSTGMSTTTRSPALYWLKYWGYKLVFRSAVNNAAKIFTPSQAVKDELLTEYRLPEEKVVVTYEGVDKSIKGIKSKENIWGKYKIRKPYVLYVGSVYPHKNVEKLVEAVKGLQTTDYRLQLVIVCARSVFWERLQRKIKEMGAEDLVNLVGFVPNEELGSLYQEAEAFVFPSLSEGFGLPGLEAMAQGTPVLASDIPVFREIYGEAAEYFDPKDSEEMGRKIKEVIKDKGKKGETVKGLAQVKKYSWQKMASETLSVYNQLTPR